MKQKNEIIEKLDELKKLNQARRETLKKLVEKVKKSSINYK